MAYGVLAPKLEPLPSTVVHSESSNQVQFLVVLSRLRRVIWTYVEGEKYNGECERKRQICLSGT